MSNADLIPCLPESAPFTPEQRAYLNGFLAGLFSRALAASSVAAPPNSTPLAPLSILFGSQTGNAENLARRIAKEAGKRGLAPTLHDMSRYPMEQLVSERTVLIVTSTYGDGEPPDNAKAFWDFLGGEAPKLPQARYSVCALGDTNYPKFCGFGKDLDARLESLGATRVHPRADCDVDYEETFARWLNSALSALAESSPASPIERRALIASPEQPKAEATAASPYSRSNPCLAAILANKRLNTPGSGKDTRHIEILLEDSALNYEVGDALGVFPVNCPELVDELLAALHFSGSEAVPGRDNVAPVREALLRHYEITKIPPPLLRVFAERTDDALLKKLIAPGVNGELSRFLWGREIIDLLLAHPEVRFTPIEFVGLLRKLNPRLYSISSSLKAHPRQVHITVNILRYESLSRRRKGVCSTFLADRIRPDEALPIFLNVNTNFRLPPNPEAPVVMVGPGTGVAPFRAFLQERRATGAKGKNWLFFGDQRAASDFMYRDELEGMLCDGTLKRLETAFSRDQAAKVYVQHRMLENAKELFGWLQDGAHFYVCGDASRMAKDVDAALHEVIQSAGALSPDQTQEYVAKMKSEQRYQRDVY